jgi:hypothetical protein
MEAYTPQDVADCLAAAFCAAVNLRDRSDVERFYRADAVLHAIGARIRAARPRLPSGGLS